jgi:signal transduction histidine kinase
MGALTSPHTGTGLGLAIVAALVRRTTGQVDVESVPGEGDLPHPPAAGT